MRPADQHSIIQNILDDTVRHARGLDYALYAVRHPGLDQELETGPEPEFVESLNVKQLDDLLERLACRDRTPDEQRDLWKKHLRRVDRALRDLDKEFVETGQGETVRVVLDLDMGGLYYTRIDSRAVLFGATLDQEEVNNGRCEREMSRMVAQIEAVCTIHGE